jgi:2-methylcitrate dehydratase
LVDAIACSVGALDSEVGIIARQIARPYEASAPECTTARLIGSGKAADLENAVFFNATLVRYLDFNDIYLAQDDGGHPSDMIPAVLSLAEACGGSGADVVVGIVASYEVFGALLNAISGGSRGWDYGLYAAIAVAAVASRMMGADAERIADAVAIAACSTISLRQARVGKLSMWKGCATAYACRSGVFAARLAVAGMTGPDKPFLGRNGLFDQLEASSREVVLADPGGPSVVGRSQYKAYPCVYHAQGALIAARRILSRMPSSQIVHVAVSTYGMCVRATAGDPEKWYPNTRETADHSLAFLVSAMLLDGEVSLKTFANRRWRDLDIASLVSHVDVTESDEFTGAYPAAAITRLSVEISEGGEIVEEVNLQDPALSAFNRASIDAKFRTLCEPVFGVSGAQQLLVSLWETAQVAHASELVGHLVVEAP